MLECFICGDTERDTHYLNIDMVGMGVNGIELCPTCYADIRYAIRCRVWIANRARLLELKRYSK